MFYMLLMLLLGFTSPQTTSAGKNEGSVDASSLVTFDDDDVSDKEDESSRSYLELGLCVPQDRLEDIDFSPNFDDDWIRLDLVFEQDSAKDSPQESAKGSCDDVEEIKPNYSGRLLEFENRFDYRNLSLYVEGEDKRKLLTKKPRIKTFTKRLRRENEMVKLPVMKRGRKRNSELFKCMKRMKRCSHCEAEETPQWRLGPLGPNTLCNACGLRYKVGRLLENYRPAASPSFDIAKHSNYYKRIMRQNYV